MRAPEDQAWCAGSLCLQIPVYLLPCPLQSVQAEAVGPKGLSLVHWQPVPGDHCFFASLSCAVHPSRSCGPQRTRLGALAVCARGSLPRCLCTGDGAPAWMEAGVLRCVRCPDAYAPMME
eukprot:1150795-Pelagomonas_calceolata.AAC.1